MSNNSMNVYSSYSIVLYEYAKADKNIKKYFQQAKLLLNLLSAQKHYLHNFLANYSINKTQRKQIIDLIARNMLTKKFKYFLYTIIDFNRCKLIIKILQKFLDLCANDLKIKNVKVFSAFELNQKLREKLKKALEKYCKTKLDIDYHIDENLIGGIKVQTNFGSIDNSYQSKLKNLKETLTWQYQNNNK